MHYLDFTSIIADFNVSKFYHQLVSGYDIELHACMIFLLISALFLK